MITVEKEDVFLSTYIKDFRFNCKISIHILHFWDATHQYILLLKKNKRLHTRYTRFSSEYVIYIIQVISVRHADCSIRKSVTPFIEPSLVFSLSEEILQHPNAMFRQKNVITRMTKSAIKKRFTLLIQISLCNPEIALNPELFGEGLLSKKEEQNKTL